jgi:hypothetical protein
MKSAFDILKDTFEGLKVRHHGRLHILTYRIDNISKIRTSDS